MSDSSPDRKDQIEQHRLSMGCVRLVSAGLIINKPGELTGYQDQCPCCKESRSDITTRRLNTAYADDESNWLTSCRICFEQAVEHYSDLWAEYWGNVL